MSRKLPTVGFEWVKDFDTLNVLKYDNMVTLSMF